MLAPRQVAVVPPLVAGGVFIGAGALLLWLQKQSQDAALRIYKRDRQFTGDAAYRRPDYKGMTGSELKRASRFLDQWKEDFYRDPLTGVTIERNQIQRELLRRSGQGGFLFIPPPVPVPVVAAGLLALAVKFAAGLSQIWGFFKQTKPTPEAKHLYPPGCRKVTGGNKLKLASSPTSGGFGGLMAEHISIYETDRKYIDGRYYWRHTFRMANGTVTYNEIAGDQERFANYRLWVMDGGTCVEENKAPAALVPGTVPKIEPEVERPKAPPLPLPEVEPQPEVEPDKREPSVVPVEPGVKPLPNWPVLPFRPKPPAVQPPVALPGSQPTQDGAVLPPAPEPIPSTPPNVVYPVPGGGPIGGTAQSPAPTLEGIAQETGRIEKKLEALLNPGNPLLKGKWDLFWKLIEFIMATQSGGQYVLREPCDPDGDGVFEERTVDFQGGYTVFGALMNRFDALAALEQAAKELRQPTCSLKPAITGEPVTVRFVSDEPSTAGERPLQKTLTYRDQTAALLETHTDHWKDFVWQAGPVCVISKGLSWGVPQVWAATAEEGKRVISHAAAVAGVDLTNPKHEWIVTGSSTPRTGQAGTMRVQRRSGLICVSKRSGSSGLPVLAGPAQP